MSAELPLPASGEQGRMAHVSRQWAGCHPPIAGAGARALLLRHLRMPPKPLKRSNREALNKRVPGDDVGEPPPSPSPRLCGLRCGDERRADPRGAAVLLAERGGGGGWCGCCGEPLRSALISSPYISVAAASTRSTSGIGMRPSWRASSMRAMELIWRRARESKAAEEEGRGCECEWW